MELEGAEDDHNTRQTHVSVWHFIDTLTYA